MSRGDPGCTRSRRARRARGDSRATGSSARNSFNIPSVITAPLASITQGLVAASTGAAVAVMMRGKAVSTEAATVAQSKDAVVSTSVVAAATSSSTPSPPPEKPATDVVAGAVARAASQGTIHPLDTMKVRLQAGKMDSRSMRGGTHSLGRAVASGNVGAATLQLQSGLTELRQLYKGVVGAASGAGIIIGTYFAFYSTAKGFLRQRTALQEGPIAFLAGATAAVGSSVVKVPLAVCIRSVQAGVYPNVMHASSSIVRAAGVRGLFTGFLPTLLEDVPDMAVKFACYETLRVACRKFAQRQPTTFEDLMLGGAAGAVAAAATTPLDVVKTVMMCNASSRPSVFSAARQIAAQGRGVRPFFRGVGPRALSNGLNSAIFFCFFEAFRQVLIKKQAQACQLELDMRELPMGDGCRGARKATAAACLSLAVPVSVQQDR